MSLRLEDHRILVALQHAGTIRGASKELLVSQPALSQRLKQIEEHWGETIFIRSHKRLALTPAGEEIVRFAENMLCEEKIVQDNVSRNSEIISGTLSLGVSSVMGQYVLPEILETYISEYPHVKLELQTGLSSSFRNNPEHFHICIIRGEPLKHDYCEELLTDRLYIVEKKNPTQTEKKKPLIEFQADASLHTTVNEWFIQHPSISYAQKIKVDQIETCKQLMSKGMGMAVLPESAIQDLSEQHYDLHPMVLDGKPLSRKTWICTNDVAKQLPQVDAFLELIKSQSHPPSTS